MFDVITLGSATKDIFLGAEKLKRGKDFCFPLGEKIEIKNVRFFSGGGGVNTASSFARQGLKTAFCGVIGQDIFGQEIIEELSQNGIDVKMVKVKPGKLTDLGLIFHAGSERTILLHHGASRFFGEKDIDWQKLGDTKWLYIAPLWGKAAKLTGKLTDFAKRNKIKTALNPSLDQLSLPKIKELLKKVAVLILNGEEASFLTGIKPYQEDKVLKTLCARRGLAQEQIVVITKGKEGAVAFDAKFVYRVEAPRVEVVDATGAGDSFGSGFVASLIQAFRGHTSESLKNAKMIEKAMQLGMANAISNIQVFGANKGLLKKGQKVSKIKVIKGRL